jgi:hypothetical protein
MRIHVSFAGVRTRGDGTGERTQHEEQEERLTAGQRSHRRMAKRVHHSPQGDMDEEFDRGQQSMPPWPSDNNLASGAWHDQSETPRWTDA